MERVEKKKIITKKPYMAKDGSVIMEDKVTLVNIRKTGRNEPCICLSGKKFKHCCLDK